jgi:hypothetical protein
MGAMCLRKRKYIPKYMLPVVHMQCNFLTKLVQRIFFYEQAFPVLVRTGMIVLKYVHKV